MTVTQPRSEMYFDEFKHQLPDIDEQETTDWIRSLDDVVDQEGETRARFLLFKLLKRARQLQVGLPPLTNTRYINTISPEQEPTFPGDEYLERRIRAHLSKGSVSVTLTDNRYTMISVRRIAKERRYEVRLHHMFADADPVITRALAYYIAENDADASRILGDFIDSNAGHVRGRARRTPPAPGSPRDRTGGARRSWCTAVAPQPRHVAPSSPMPGGTLRRPSSSMLSRS